TRPPAAATLPVKGRDAGCIGVMEKYECSGLPERCRKSPGDGAQIPPPCGEGGRRRRTGGGPPCVHRLTSHVVVPSLLSLSATPIAASSSRMRSDSAQFLAARAARRKSIMSSISASVFPIDSKYAFRAFRIISLAEGFERSSTLRSNKGSHISKWSV